MQRRTLLGMTASTVAASGLFDWPLALAQTPINLPKLTLYTGDPDLNYFKVGLLLKDQLSSVIAIDVQPSKGALENLDLVANNPGAGALVQLDTLLAYGHINPASQARFKLVQTLYPEVVHFLCNTTKFTDSRVTGLLDNTKTSLAIGDAKSGSNATWISLTEIEPRYKGVPTINSSGQEALTEVIAGRIDCMLLVTGLNSGLIQDANTAAKDGAPLKLLRFNDSDFTKASKASYQDAALYTSIDLPKDNNYYYLTGYSRPSSIATQAVLIVNLEWYTANKGNTYNQFLRTVRQSISAVQAAIGQ